MRLTLAAVVGPLVYFLGVLLPAQVPPADTAGGEGPKAVLDFRVTDEDGGLIPARLTFRRAGIVEPALFTNLKADPDRLAVRRNVVYTLAGEGRITVPPGPCRVEVTRGIEWSMEVHDLALVAGGTTELRARLRREVDTRGWIGADFHLHTLTHSGHGDADMKERVITFCGEGLEFAVATDHNHHTDYRPVMKELGAEDGFTTVTGNEISGPLGHFNAFPLDPARRPVDHRLTDATALFKLVRAEPNAFGIVPVIQVNHPRWSGIDYFRIGALDPVTADTKAPGWSWDFDTVEVLNETEGWGWEDADVPGAMHAGEDRHWVLGDWFNLLNRGRRVAAVGNSDSHHVHSTLAGLPRNFVPSASDDPAHIDPVAVAAALRRGDCFTTLGPFIRWSVDDQPMGSTVAAKDGRVTLRVRVEAAGFVDCDVVRIIVNGDERDRIVLPAGRGALRIDTTRTVVLTRDSWIALLVEGDEPLPIIPTVQSRPILPFAVTNPVRVDADGDGRWVPPAEQSLDLVRSAGDDGRLPDKVAALAPSERALCIVAAADGKHPQAVELAVTALADPARPVRLAGMRAARTLGDERLRAALTATWFAAEPDLFLKSGTISALAVFDRPLARERARLFLDDHGLAGMRRYHAEISELLPGKVSTEWMVLGAFPGETVDALQGPEDGPEKDGGLDRAWPLAAGGEVRWQRAEVRADGVVDLNAVYAPGELKGKPRTVAYAQAWLFSAVESAPGIAFGTDDACRLFVNGILVIEDRRTQDAQPWGHLVHAPVHQGWNRVLLKIWNSSGDFGFTVRVLDDGVRWALRPEAATAGGSR